MWSQNQTNCCRTPTPDYHAGQLVLAFDNGPSSSAKDAGAPLHVSIPGGQGGERSSSAHSTASLTQGPPYPSHLLGEARHRVKTGTPCLFPWRIDGRSAFSECRILDVRRCGQGFQYLVDWEDYEAKERLWIPRRLIHKTNIDMTIRSMTLCAFQAEFASE